jgi:hypothetical protein
LRHLCEELDASYDTRVEMWRDKYL